MDVMQMISDLKLPFVITMILNFLDINLLMFTAILIIVGMLIDFLIFINSAPVPLPYDRQHFMKSSVKAAFLWLCWIIVFWILTSTISAVGSYVGLPFLPDVANCACNLILTLVIILDLRKLRYTRFYYFKPIKKFVDLICQILDCGDDTLSEKPI
jgi:hypothetical protein